VSLNVEVNKSEAHVIYFKNFRATVKFLLFHNPINSNANKPFQHTTKLEQTGTSL
jgi:hypothetical protein